MGIDRKAYLHLLNKDAPANSKYHNKRTTIDGTEFDSKKEALRYQHLKLAEKAGAIKELILQPRFELQPSFKKNNKSFRQIDYIADFKYWDVNEKKWIIEDVKGFSNPVFLLKQKLFEYKYKELNLRLI